MLSYPLQQVFFQVGWLGKVRLSMVWRLPDSLSFQLWQTVMQEFHIKVANWVTVIKNLEAAVISELTDDGGFYILALEESQQSVNFFGRDRQYHPLLRFGHPYLSVG